MIGPEEGELADGEWGVGRMAALPAIVAAARDALNGPGGGRAASGKQALPLRGKKVVVTAGGTEEPIDPVRVITNRSSGKMGFALAEEAQGMGADVTLVMARTTVPPPTGVRSITAMTAAAMGEAVSRAMRDADALVMAAAVSDYRPVKTSATKLRRSAEGMTLDLSATPDILESIRKKYPKKYLAGFALETENGVRRGREKLKRKGLDLIAVNNPLTPGAEFGSDRNEVTILDRSGKAERVSLRSKREVARAILQRVAAALAAGKKK